MRGGVRWYLVGSLVLLGLFGCGRSGWFETREPWRHEAELACLKSGAVKEGNGIAQLRPITGPGACGADFPLKVSALGGNSALGFADEPRPPAGVPYPAAAAAVQRAPLAPPSAPYPEDLYVTPRYAPRSAPVAEAPVAPMRIHPPGLDAPENEPDEPDDAAAPTDQDGPPANRGPLPPYRPRGPYAQPIEPDPVPPLGPQRAPNVAGAGAAITPAATLACPMVSAVDRWVADSVQPAAQRWFGQPVTELHQISAYSCRSMNNQRGARISEHAFGNALDVAAFTLADGRKVTVREGWRGLPEERGFLHDVHAAACRQFMTVLGPGSNAFHYDHFHLDLMRRAGSRYCNPSPIPGDLVAGRRGEPFVTGSVEQQRSARTPALGFAPERARTPFDSLPRAVAGED